MGETTQRSCWESETDNWWGDPQGRCSLWLAWPLREIWHLFRHRTKHEQSNRHGANPGKCSEIAILSWTGKSSACRMDTMGNHCFFYDQSNEVSSSNNMELEGLKRVLAKLSGLTITKIITDRHPSIAKYLREQVKNVVHLYDVWHVAKGILKETSLSLCSIVFCILFNCMLTINTNSDFICLCMFLLVY